MNNIMNGVTVENFIREISLKEALKILDENPINPITHDGNVGLLTVYGAVIPKSARFIVELGGEGENNYIATIGMLDRSGDEVFVRLKKDINEPHDDNMPEFKDIFKIKEL